MKSPKRILNPQQIEKYVKSKIKNIDNQQLFQKQLKSSITQKYDQQSKFIEQQLHRKQIRQQFANEEIKRRQNISNKLNERLCRSQLKRNEEMKKKNQYKRKDSQYKNNIFIDRLKGIKRQEYEDRLKNLEKYRKKYQNGEGEEGQDYYIVPKNTDLSNSRHYRKKQQNAFAEYERKVLLAKQKKIFEKPKLKQRQLSLVQIVPRQKEQNHKIQQERINKMGEHMHRIQQKCKKKQKMLQDKSKRCQSIEKYHKTIQQDRLKEIKQKQQTRKKQLIKKLSSSSCVLNKPKLSFSSNLRTSFAGSQSTINIIQNQPPNHKEQAQKYRKQIKQKINEYIEAQKRKLLKQSI